MTFKRFDLFSLLAVLSILAVLGFQSIFIFELYNFEYAKLEPYLPEAWKPMFAPVAPVESDGEEPAPVG